MANKGFLSIFKSECMRFAYNYRLMLLTLGVPLLLFFYYAGLMDKQVATDLPVTVLDQDNSVLSRQFINMVQANATMKVAYRVSDEIEGENTLKVGKSYALIIIPKDFSKNIQKGLNPNVTCYYNGQYLLAGGLIMKDFQLVAMSLNAGIAMQTLEQKGMMPVQAVQSVMPVNIDPHILYNPFTNYSFYLNLAFFPMAFQIVIMVVSIYVFGAVLKYKRGKALLEKAKGSLWAVVLGKILPYTIMFSLLGFFMNALLFYKMDMELRGSFVVVNLFFITFVIVIQSVSLFLAAVLPSLRAALNIGADYAALAFSFAGYTFPPDGMTPLVKVISYLFPFHSYMRFNVDYAIKGIAFNDDQIGYVITLAAFACLGIIALPIYYKKLKTSQQDD